MVLKHILRNLEIKFQITLVAISRSWRGVLLVTSSLLESWDLRAREAFGVCDVECLRIQPKNISKITFSNQIKKKCAYSRIFGQLKKKNWAERENMKKYIEI